MEDIRKGVCPLCWHNQVIQGWPLDFASGMQNPLALAHVQSFVTGPRQDKPLGPLLTYTCRRCGYTQWFVKDPETVPIDEKAHTRLIEGRPEPGGPYR